MLSYKGKVIRLRRSVYTTKGFFILKNTVGIILDAAIKHGRYKYTCLFGLNRIRFDAAFDDECFEIL